MTQPASPMTLTDLHVYRLKVALFVHRYGEKSGFFGTGQMAQVGSHVWLDQVTPDGWAVFGLFKEQEDGVLPGLYVKCPVDIAADQVEPALDAAGQPVALSYTAPAP